MSNSLIEDNRSTEEIIDAAYSIQDEDKYWNLIYILQKRGSEHEFREAKKLCESKDPINREIGSNILSQLGWESKAFHKESVSILIELLKDQNNKVVASAAYSLGHRNDQKAIPYLLKQIKNKNSNVRNGIAFGLSCHDDKSAVNGLVILSKDIDRDVRNWATFGLGSQTDLDNNKIRTALLERINDKDPEIRGEALIGLARRKDSRIKEALKTELLGEFHGDWAVEAAELTQNAEFVPLLMNLRKKLEDSVDACFISNINEAIEACSGTSQ